MVVDLHAVIAMENIFNFEQLESMKIGTGRYLIYANRSNPIRKRSMKKIFNTSSEEKKKCCNT
jgi:hypothetical protein